MAVLAVRLKVPPEAITDTGLGMTFSMLGGGIRGVAVSGTGVRVGSGVGGGTGRSARSRDECTDQQYR